MKYYGKDIAENIWRKRNPRLQFCRTYVCKFICSRFTRTISISKDAGALHLDKLGVYIEFLKNGFLLL